jgi:hypothetical protein
MFEVVVKTKRVVDNSRTSMCIRSWMKMQAKLEELEARSPFYTQCSQQVFGRAKSSYP